MKCRQSLIRIELKVWPKVHTGQVCIWMLQFSPESPHSAGIPLLWNGTASIFFVISSILACWKLHVWLHASNSVLTRALHAFVQTDLTLYEYVHLSLKTEGLRPKLLPVGVDGSKKAGGWPKAVFRCSRCAGCNSEMHIWDRVDFASCIYYVACSK